MTESDNELQSLTLFLTYCRLLKQTSWMKFVSTFTLLTEFLTQHQSLSVLHTK